MGEMQLRETPTARPALASSPCYLNPAFLEDAWPIPMGPAERIGGRHARWNHPRDISLCRSFSARRRRLRRAGGPATRGGTFGFYQHRTTCEAAPNSHTLLA